MEPENGMKVLDNLIKLGTVFNSFSNIAKYAIIGGIVLLAFNAGGCEGDKKIQEFKIKYENLQNEATQAKQFADSVNKQVIQLTKDVQSKNDTINILNASVYTRDKQRAGLKQNLNNLQEQLRGAKDTAELVQIQDHIIDNMKVQLDVADKTSEDLRKLLQLERYKVTKLDSAVVLANARGDRLQTVVDSLITLPIPKPPRQWVSKKTLGVVAFVGGVLAGDYLARR